MTGARARTRNAQVVLAALAATVVLAGCALATGGGPAPSLAPPTLPPSSGEGSAVVVRIERLGGMVGWEQQYLSLPRASVYADGRVLAEVEATAPSIDQEPALPQILQRTLTPAGLEAVLARARAAGVGDGADLGQPGVTDVPTTRFVLATDDGPVWSDAYALSTSAGLDVPVGQAAPSPSIAVGRGDGDGTLTAAQAKARYKLLDLAAALVDLPAALGANQVGAQAPYAPQALAVLAVPTVEDPGAGAQVLAWPGPALPGRGVKVAGASCTVVGGADLALVLDAASQATRSTAWSQGGRTWTVFFRPLLPEENGCRDLAEAPLRS